MKMNDYKNVLNRMHPNENLENEIIEKCMNTESKAFKKRRFAPVLAVAVALCIGTVGVSAAMNYDWIKSFFEDDFVISEDIESLVAQTSNYECWSNCGIKMSLDGVVADEQSIYCQFNIDEMPEGYDLSQLFLDKIQSKSFNPSDTGGYSGSACGNVNDEGKFIVSASFDTQMFADNDNIAIRILSLEQLCNYNNSEDSMTIYDAVDENTEDSVTEEKTFYDVMTPENTEKYDSDYDNILIKFDIEFSDEKIPSVKISEDKIQHNGYYGNLINNVEITPFKILCDVSATGYIDVEGKIILENGEEISLETGSFSTGSYVDENGNIKTQSTQEWTFGKPVNPEKTAKIYIGNECIYTK